MATQYFDFGPCTIKYGTKDSEATIGQSDGQLLVTVREVRPNRPVTTDASGGIPVEFVQQMGYDIIVFTLINWDYAETNKLLSGLLITTGSVTYPGPGTGPTVGALRVADGGNKSLVVIGNKLTAQNGGYKLQWDVAFRDPDAESEWLNIGSDVSRRSIVMRAIPNSSGIIRTETTIT